MDRLLDHIIFALAHISSKAVITILAALLLVLFVLLIFCLCRAAKLGDNENAEMDAQYEWLQNRK